MDRKEKKKRNENLILPDPEIPQNLLKRLRGIDIAMYKLTGLRSSLELYFHSLDQPSSKRGNYKWTMVDWVEYYRVRED